MDSMDSAIYELKLLTIVTVELWSVCVVYQSRSPALGVSYFFHSINIQQVDQSQHRQRVGMSCARSQSVLVSRKDNVSVAICG